VNEAIYPVRPHTFGVRPNLAPEVSTAEHVLRVRGLSKAYGEVQALTDVDFDILRGQLIAVIGPSGSGKTTLIRCLNRLVEPTRGEIHFDGVDVRALKGVALRRTRARMAMIFQHYNLVTRLSVLENVLHGRLGYKGTWAGMLGIYSDQEKRRALEVLALVGLEEQVYRRCDQLSGGQKQRVGIARALVQDPHLILCDEPISSLDPSSAKIVMDYLKRIQLELGMTLFVNLHQVDVAKRYADRILGFNRGRLVFDGPPAELSRETIHTIYGTEAGELILD
jgi:phosphonate transport system ATP-binding protein